MRCEVLVRVRVLQGGLAEQRGSCMSWAAGKGVLSRPRSHRLGLGMQGGGC